MNIKELKEFLTEEKFSFGNANDPKNKCDWYAWRKTKYLVRECTCNEGKGIAIVIRPFIFDSLDHKWESVTVEIRGETEDKFWWNLECYSLDSQTLKDNLSIIERSLVDAWNALYVVNLFHNE